MIGSFNPKSFFKSIVSLCFILNISFGNVAFSETNDSEEIISNEEKDYFMPLSGNRHEYTLDESKVNLNYVDYLAVDNIEDYFPHLISTHNGFFVLAYVKNNQQYEYCAYSLQKDIPTYCTENEKDFFQFVGKDVGWLPFIYKEMVAFPYKRNCIDSFSCNHTLLFDTSVFTWVDYPELPDGYIIAEREKKEIEGKLPPLFAYTNDDKNMKYCKVTDDLGNRLIFDEVFPLDGRNFYISFMNKQENFRVFLLFHHNDLQSHERFKMDCQTKVIEGLKS